MKINDKRNTQINLTFDLLVCPGVYINVQQQRYVMCCDNDTVVDLSTGELFDYDDMGEDGFLPVNATLEIQ